MTRKRRRATWLLSALLLAGFGIGGVCLFRSRARPGDPVGKPNEYVDARLCAGCHPKIAETYRHTGMARSFYRPRSDLMIEDFSTHNRFYHSASGTRYRMVERGGKYYQRRWQIGYGAKETNVEETEIDFVMGSGNHVRTYLHRTARGTLIELPLAWYSENGGAWAMNPGYDTDHPPSHRKIGYDCMFCHNGYPAIPAGHEDPGSEPVFPGEIPEGIDCQRCHGPGAEHVRAAQQNKGNPRGSIVNPARLNTDRRMEVCMQCHLETTSFRLPNAIKRFDRGPFSYRAGEPLGDFAIFFDHAPGSGYEEKFEIVSSAYRLRQSRCFRESKGKLTCITCHDPHDIPRGADALRQYNGKCRQCHASGTHTSSGNCIDCHMPKRRTEDVVHAIMTDHLIQRNRPSRNLLAAMSERHDVTYTGEVVPYYPATLPPTGDNALYVALAQVSQTSNLEKGTAQLEAAIAKQHPERAEFYLELGDGWRNSGKPYNAIAPYEEAVRRRPDSAIALRRLAAALKESGQTPRAAELLNRATQTFADDPQLWYESALLDSELGQSASALAGFEKAIALDPDFAEAHNSLGAVLAESGQSERAEKEFRESIRIRPDDGESHGNLANLLASGSDPAQALYHFDKAVRLLPNDARIRFNYGVTLGRMNRLKEAQAQIEAAVRNRPEFAEAHGLLGNLLEQKGQVDSAIGEYREAIRIRPEFHKAQLDLGAALAATGNWTEAAEHLRSAAGSSDAEIQKQAIQALQLISKR